MDKRQDAAIRILLLCARCRFDGSARAEAGALLRQEVDWDHLLDVGQRHYLLPLLHDRLSGLEHGAIPPAVAERLKSVYFTSLLRNRRLGDELARLAGALGRAGIEAIVLKGGALARTVYAEPALRPMMDLDLLVRPEQIDRAGPVLEGLGFRRSPSLPAHLVPFQQEFGGGVEWICREEGRTTRLDVQHDLLGVDWCRGMFAIEPGALWDAAQPLPLEGGAEMRQLSPEDTLIHLCLHPALHHGYASPLIGYVDMDRLVDRAGSETFWARVLERAARFRVRTAVYYGLLGAGRLLATPVPAGVLAALDPGRARVRRLERLAPLELGTVLQGANRRVTGLHQVLLYAALADRPRDAASMAREVLFPDQAWLAARYGEGGRGPAWPHRLAHPFRVARALLRSLHRPLVQSSLD